MIVGQPREGDPGWRRSVAHFDLAHPVVVALPGLDDVAQRIDVDLRIRLEFGHECGTLQFHGDILNAHLASQGL